MMQVVVTTKEELKKAIDEKVDKIIVKGDLVENVLKARKIKKYSKWSLLAFSASILLIPATGGTSLLTSSLFLAGGATTATTATVGTTIVLSTLGLGTILILAVEYDAVDARIGFGDKELTLKLRKQR